MGKRLYILRHGNAQEHQAGGKDRDRELSPKGREEADVIAQIIIESGNLPQKALVSSAVRTRQTAEQLVSGGAVKQEAVEHHDRLYNASAGELLHAVNGLSDDIDCAIIVAHNPGVHELSLVLTGNARDERLVRFPTCSLVELSFTQERWREIVPGCARLENFNCP